MFVPRLYYPHALSVEATIHLDKAASHYLAQVVRLRPQDPIILFNGEGGEYHGVVINSDKTTNVHLTSYEPVNRESPLKITLGQGIARGDRMDLIMQKATELGVHQIVPLITERSLVKLDQDRQQKRHHHWEQIIISACEQSGSNILPQLSTPLKLCTWAETVFEGLSLMLDPDASQILSDLQVAPHTPIRIAIGSESGWSDIERKSMIQGGFQGIRLGPRVLRTETAGLAAISVIQSLWGDM